MLILISNYLANFDQILLTFFHNLSLQYGEILTPIAKMLAVIGNLPFLLLGWLGLILFFVLKDKSCGLWMSISLILGAIFTTLILKNLIFRPRPYLSDVEAYKTWWQDFNLKIDWDTSFPSGHACAALASSLSFFCWSKKKYLSWLILLYPLIIGASRLYLCVHYPSDIIGAYVVASISVIVAKFIVDLLYRNFQKYPDKFFAKYCLPGKEK